MVERSSTDYDIVCSLEGVGLDFRSDLGRYFLCECKDWGRPADVDVMTKFCSVLDSTKSRFGIIFAKQGITGAKTTTAAARERPKTYQSRGIAVVVVDDSDLERVIRGENLVAMIRSKYEEVRFDLRKASPAMPVPGRRASSSKSAKPVNVE